MELIKFRNALFRNKIQMRGGGADFLDEKILNYKKTFNRKKSLQKQNTFDLNRYIG